MRYIALWMVAATLAAMTSCSTQQNTASSRWWHAFNARYNTYYNGKVAYIDGSLEKENGHKDNFTELLPLYPVGSKSSREIGKGNYDRAITKAEKVIHQHSIKRRPVWDKQRRKTAKDIEWLGRREYNPFLWKAWMLMGRSQFHKGSFDEAASTFSYMSRHYATQPAIYGKARAWLAKAYVEEGWLYDAEDVIRNMQRDSMDWRAVREWDYTYADYYLHAGDYRKAIPYLKKVIRHEMRRKQKAREWYLLGQLYAALGERDSAYRAYRHVVRMNPPYELEFNARIAQTEVVAKGRAKSMVGRLRRMAASDNNKDYADQIFYAIGNIYLAERDTAKAIGAYEEGNRRSVRNGVEKGVLLLQLGDLYWEKEKYSEARRCYGEAIGLLDKDRPDYRQLADRSRVLDELVPHTEQVALQDSLQALAAMDDDARNAAIDRVIDALKKKEKEERNALAEAEAQRTVGMNAGMGGGNMGQQASQATDRQQSGKWYFYNPMAVSQGKATFEKLWGKRENVDDWQRINKTVVADLGGVEEMTDEMRDSLAREAERQDSLRMVPDSVQNDPHQRAYYMAQIPFTPEQKAASDALIMDGLFQSGVIFKDKLDHLPLSEKQLLRLTTQYPAFERMDEAYYHLFLLYSRMHKPEQAATYVSRLQAEFPESLWTVLLTDPYFAENARLGTHLEDSLYAATYEAFRANRLGEAAANVALSASRFPMGANRDKFLFVGALTKLNAGDADGCLADMKTVVEQFPQSRMSEMAGMIINGVNAGRRLRGGRFDVGDVWSRRTDVLNEGDTVAARGFEADRTADFLFVIVYHPDSVPENQVLYELARYNFTNYLVRNFEIAVSEVDGLHRMQVSGFRNYDEVLQYARQLFAQSQLRSLLHGHRTLLISESNLGLIGNPFSYDDYDAFYHKHFAPLKVSTFQLLVEPEEITTKEAKAPTVEQIDKALDSGLFLEEASDKKPESRGTLVVTPEEPEKTSANKGVTVKVEEEKEKVSKTGIYFKDSKGTVVSDSTKTEKTKAPAKPKKKTLDLENEYYELEGF